MLAENARYTESFDRSELTAAPLRRLAILACMDARLDVRDVLGLRTGDAHIIRNAGGLATDDAIRSLIISQQLLGTDQIVVIGHTGCGLLRVDEAALRDRLSDETGQPLDLAFGSFDDLEASVRSSLARLRAHPWITPVPINGLIFDVATGRLRELT
jgi:carbonic anhydrase